VTVNLRIRIAEGHFADFEAAFVKFKALADKKKEVFDEDLEALVDDQLELDHGLWELVGLQVMTGSSRLKIFFIRRGMTSL
jgi:isopropylmalate/homocitrate/citramalate synthase